MILQAGLIEEKNPLKQGLKPTRKEANAEIKARSK